MPEMITMLVEKLLIKFGFKGQNSIIDGCFKISNSGGFQAYSGEKVELAPGDEEAYRHELLDKYGERGKKIDGIGNGSGIIKLLIVIVLEIIIFGAFVFPLFGKAEGDKLFVLMMPGVIGMIAVPLLVLVLSKSNKVKLELGEAIGRANIEVFDYEVGDKFETSTGKGKPSYYIFIGEVSIPVDIYIYNAVKKGDKVRCAIVDDLGTARYLAVIDKAPAPKSGDPRAAEAKPTASDLFDMFIAHEKENKKNKIL